MNIFTSLRGGDRRSLGQTEAVVSYVLANQAAFDELFACLFDEDEIVRMRAGDGIEKICRQHPAWLTPYTDRLLSEVAAIDQPSVQWHLAQMIGELELSASQHRQAIAILKRNLESATDWIVLNYSLEVFADLARTDTDLQPYLIKQLRRHTKNSHKSVVKRATKLLTGLTDG